MIKIKRNLEKFKSILKILEGINVETDFIFQADKLCIRIVDPSNISLGAFEISNTFFEEYVITPSIFTVDISKLLLICNYLKSQEVNLKFENGKVYIDDNESNFILDCYVGKEDDRPLPTPVFKSVWKIKSSVLFNKVEKLAEFNYVCKLEQNNGLFIKVKGNMVEGNIKLDAINISGENTACYYDLSYIDKLSELKSVFNEITFKFGYDVPCSIQTQTNELKFDWFLAPRVE